MIREEKKITKYNYKKPLNILLLEYFKTVIISILFAVIITSTLAIHARNEMIKDIFASKESQHNIDKQIAVQIINSNQELLKDVKNEKYSVCMYVGGLYEAVEDYKNAQKAYEAATKKVKPGEYKPYYSLICTLVAQEKFKEAELILKEIVDKPNKKLIKFKTRSYIVIGDKYYSIGKFLSAAKNYEKAEFYYNKFVKRDSVVENSIRSKIINSYIHAADEIVKMGYNSEAVRYLKKVEKFCPDDLNIKYKLAIIMSDSDPEKAVEYLEKLINKVPQNVDYGVYCSALMKSANIADLDGRQTQAKVYRYKIHSMDLFMQRKVIYKNDIDTILESFNVKKVFLIYPLRAKYGFLNMSNNDIKFLKGDFVLSEGDKDVERITADIAAKDTPLLVGSDMPNEVDIKFKKKIFTKKEFSKYTIKIYVYKDEKFKTLVAETKIPEKSFSVKK